MGRIRRGVSLTGMAALLLLVVALLVPAVATAMAPPLTNDNLADATVISGDTGSWSGHNWGAGTELGEPDDGNGSSLWFLWTAPSVAEGPTDVTFDMIGSDYDTYLSAYSGTDFGSMTQLAANDDYVGVQSKISFAAYPGETYFIRAAGYVGNQGSIALNWSKGAGEISGQVTDESSGSSIAGVQVKLFRWSVVDEEGWEDWVSVRTAKTDENGCWTAVGLADGKYRVSAIADGYYSEAWNDQAGDEYGWEGDQITVADGGAVGDINAALTPVRPIEADAFENDDSAFRARMVKPNGTADDHTIYPAGDRDWVKFPVRAGYIYEPNIRKFDTFTSFNCEFFDGNEQSVETDFEYLAREDGFAYLLVENWNSEEAPYRLSIAERLPATIRGTVRDEVSGDPIAGAMVSLEVRTDDGEWYWEEGYWQQSADDGTYAIEGLNADGREYALSFWTWGGGYVDEYFDNATTIALEPGQEFVANADLTPTGVVHGTVLSDADGAPLANVLVYAYEISPASGYVSGYSELYTIAETDVQGRYQLNLDPARAYAIRFHDYLSGYANEWFDDTNDSALAACVQVASGSSTQADASLARRADLAIVEGRVTDALTGNPIHGIAVDYSSGEPGTSGYMSGYLAWTNSDGRYRAALLPGRPYKIRFADTNLDGYLPRYFDGKADEGTADVVTLLEGERLIANADLERNPQMGVVSGAVRDEITGDPIPYADVYTYVSGYSSLSSYTQADASGYYTLRGIRPGFEYRVEAGAAWYAWETHTVVVTAGEDRVADFRLGKEAWLSGRLVEEGTGKPVSGITVTLYKQDSASGYGCVDSVKTDWQGRYTFWGLKAGTAPYQLGYLDDERGIWRGGAYPGGCEPADAGTLNLKPGKNIIEDTLPRRTDIGALSGKVTDASTLSGAGLVQVDLAFEGDINGGGFVSGYWARTHTRADGSYSFDGLPNAYTYRLKFTDPYGGGRFVDQFYSGKSFYQTANTFKFDAETSALVVDFVYGSLVGPDTDGPSLGDDARGEYEVRATVNLYADDMASGVRTLFYAVDSGETSSDTTSHVSVDFADQGAHTIVYWAEDNLGNVSEPVTRDFTITADRTSPQVSDDIRDNPYWDSASFNLHASDSGSGVMGLYYVVDDGETLVDPSDNVTLGLATEGPHSVVYWAKDNAGNFSDPVTKTFWINSIAPTLKDDALGTYWGSATIQLSASDTHSGVRALNFEVDGGMTQSGAMGVTSVEVLGGGSHSIEYWAEDNAGNVSDRVVRVFKIIAQDIDVTVPDLTDDILSEYVDGATVSMSAEDLESGVWALYYTVDDGDEVSEPTGYVELDFIGAGAHTITYWAEDLAGNVSDPITREFTISDSSADVDPPTLSDNVEASYVDSATFTLYADDADSGVMALYYALDGAAEPEAWASSVVQVKVSRAGTHSVTYWAEDWAGNMSDQVTREFEVVVTPRDTTPPSVSASVSPVPDTNGWSAAPARMTLSADDGTGVGGTTITYRIGAGSPLTYTSQVTLPTGASTITYWATDALGNSSGEKTLNVKVDGSAPTVSASYTKKFGKWASSPVDVSLNAVDDGVGSAGISYGVEGAALKSYTGAFVVTAPAGVAKAVVVSHKAVDALGNESSVTTSAVWVDNAAPAAPAVLAWSNISTTTVTLIWNTATDSGAGVAAYEVFQDGVSLGVITQTSYRVTGLIPGSSRRYAIVAIDAVGNRSSASASLDLEIPAIAETSPITETGAATATLTVETLGSVEVSFENVTVPGAVTVTVTEDVPAAPETGFRFMGKSFDIDFSGTLAADSGITITLPYDSAIPDARARNLKVKHWTNGGWENIIPDVVDTVNHTVTFTVSSLSPFVYAEAESVDQTTRLTAGFNTSTNAASQLVVGYGGSAVLVGKLTDAVGGALPGKQVIVESWNAALSIWVKVTDAVATANAGEYQATVSSANKATYRMRFVADAYNTESSGASRIVYPKAYVSNPIAPASMTRGRSYTVYGWLKPLHTAGTSPVQIKMWRKTSSGAWKYYGKVSAKAYNYRGYTKYVRSMRLTTSGKWRLQAYAPADAGHYATVSTGYDYVTVK